MRGEGGFAEGCNEGVSGRGHIQVPTQVGQRLFCFQDGFRGTLIRASEKKIRQAMVKIGIIGMSCEANLV